MADKAASARARDEGNAFFRKGKWSDAAAAYARAGEADPEDAVPWANRAQAWIKLERWTDAEADASAALARDPASLKALYRRAVARRALGRPLDAASDLQAVLARDPNNAMAAGELSEVEMEVATAAAKERAVAKMKEKEEEKEKERQAEAAAASLAPAPASPAVTSAPTSQAKSGFAALRKSRDARPAYAGAGAREPPAAATATSSAAGDVSPLAPVARSATTTTPPREPSPVPPPALIAKVTAPPAPAPSTSTLPLPPAPADPASTAPGAGLNLLRALTSCPAEHRRAYLRHYTPDIVARIVAPVLEPDGLGLLLTAVGGASAADNSNESDGAEKEWTRTLLAGLRTVPRWRMTAAMLSRSEKEAGEKAWAAAGGEGKFI